MKWILGLLMPYRSFLIGLAGVLFVAMMSGMVMGYVQLKAQTARIEAQATRITDLTEINEGWREHAAKLDRFRALEQANALLLQDKLALIEGHHAETSAQLKNLEASNVEVRNYLAGKLPADIKRLLEAK